VVGGAEFGEQIAAWKIAAVTVVAVGEGDFGIG